MIRFDDQGRQIHERNPDKERGPFKFSNVDRWGMWAACTCGAGFAVFQGAASAEEARKRIDDAFANHVGPARCSPT